VANFRFGDVSAMKSPDLDGVRGYRCWPAQRLAVLPGAGQSGASSLTQDLPFECSEDGQQPRLRSTRSRTADEYGHAVTISSVLAICYLPIRLSGAGRPPRRGHTGEELALHWRPKMTDFRLRAN